MALLGSFTILLGLIIFFIVHPDVFDRTKNVITFLFEFLLLGSVVTYFGKRIKKGADEYGSISTALSKLILEEPLLHSLIWIFIVIQTIAFSYIVPIHYLEVNLKDRISAENIDSKLINESILKTRYFHT